MRRTLPILCAALAALVLAACGGGNDGAGDSGGSATANSGSPTASSGSPTANGGSPTANSGSPTANSGSPTANGGGSATDTPGIFFAPEKADALAHASLPGVADLPGAGWEITAQDNFGGEQEGVSDFQAFAATEPACSELAGLANAGGIFGSGSDGPSAGHAKVEFENADSGGLLPTSVEVEVKIENTVAEVESKWETVKQLLESDKIEACMLAVYHLVFLDLGAAGDFTVEVEAVEPSSVAPNDGGSMAFLIHLDVAGTKLDLAMEMYLWPYGNAKVDVMFLGLADMLNGDITGPTLDAVAAKLKAAAGS